MNNRNKLIVTLFIMGLMLQLKSIAQQQMENSMSQYFHSQMLWNAGSTGIDGNKIYVLQNRSWVGFDGAPVMTSLSGEWVFGANSAAGLQLFSDVTGILYRTFGVVNYAYRVKLSKDKNLRVGISLAFSGDRLNTNYVDQGGASDPLIIGSINRNIQYDGNIGLVYTNNKLKAGISFFRLRENISVKSGGSANLAVTQMGATYDVDVNDKVLLKPLMMLRLYRGTDPLIDLGAQAEFNKLLNTMLVYQTSGNVRVGAGLRIHNLVDVNFFYNTNVRVANAASQQYELGVGFQLKGKKQD